MSTYQASGAAAPSGMSPEVVKHERRQAALRARALLLARREQARTREEQAARR